MKITVEKNRKKVTVLNFGYFPICIVKNKKRQETIVSNGFEVRIKSDGLEWRGITKVFEGKDYYQFVLMDEELDPKGWRENPTAAYRYANEKWRNEKFRVGTNGALLIGISYPKIQEILFEKFCKSSEEMFRSTDEEAIEIEEEDENPAKRLLVDQSISENEDPIDRNNNEDDLDMFMNNESLLIDLEKLDFSVLDLPIL